MGATSTSLSVHSDLKNLATIRDFIKEAAETVALSKEKISELQLAVDESSANIIIHGYKDSAGDLVINVSHEANKMIVSLSDTAPLYNPLQEAPLPELEIPLEEREVGGMGVVLLKLNTDETEYKVTANGGNELIMTKFYA